jgi:hypothetical protein
LRFGVGIHIASTRSVVANASSTPLKHEIGRRFSEKIMLKQQAKGAMKPHLEVIALWSMIPEQPAPHLDGGADTAFPSLTEARRLRGDHAQTTSWSAMTHHLKSSCGRCVREYRA